MALAGRGFAIALSSQRVATCHSLTEERPEPISRIAKAALRHARHGSDDRMGSEVGAAVVENLKRLPAIAGLEGPYLAGNHGGAALRYPVGLCANLFERSLQLGRARWKAYAANRQASRIPALVYMAAFRAHELVRANGLDRDFAADRVEYPTRPKPERKGFFVSDWPRRIRAT